MYVMYFLGYLIVIIGIWMLPVFFMGYPVHMPSLDAARLYMETGAIPYGNSHLSAIVFGMFSRWISWDNLTGWTLLSAVALGLALVPLWWSVRRVFGEWTSWVTVSLFAMMPLYVQEAIHLNDYSFAYLTLFLSGAAFLAFKNRILGLMLSGALFGMVLGLKEAFVVLLPWLVVSYVWSYKKKWKEVLLHAFVFIGCAGLIYTIPVFPVVISDGDFMKILPMEGTKPFGEFYPDQYTYDFEREWYEGKFLKERSQAQSFLERTAGDNRLILFGVGDQGFIFSFLNGALLLFNRIPSFFATDTFGGAVMWLFIFSGGIVLYRRDRKILWWMVGLVAMSELILRFVFHYQRIHLMNYGWIFSILCAVGIMNVTKHRLWQVVAVTVFLVIHLLQMNRLELSRLYGRSVVPDIVAVADIIKDIPEDSLVAVPSNFKGVEALSGRVMTIFREETISRLLEKEALNDVLKHYGVTHVLRYSDALTKDITRAAPSVVALYIPKDSKLTVTPVMNYLLHFFR